MHRIQCDYCLYVCLMAREQARPSGAMLQMALLRRVSWLDPLYFEYTNERDSEMDIL
jgi:hypothetical protein